jgi:hypothetical protein
MEMQQDCPRRQLINYLLYTHQPIQFISIIIHNVIMQKHKITQLKLYEFEHLCNFHL